MSRIFIYGLGYTALALAGQLRSLGWDVAGTTRRPDKIDDLRALGFTVYGFGREQPLRAASAMLADFPYILHSIPPDELGDPVYDAQSSALVDQGRQLRWFGYLSSTAVYGDHGGAMVDETAICQPNSRRGQMRLKVERQWLALQERCGVPVHIFRLAGLYGPGRNVLRELQRGKAAHIVQPGQLFNRIHVADVVQALLASLHRPDPGGIYNLADDCPASSDVVLRYGAALLGMTPPAVTPLEAATPMMRGFYAESKIVSNARAKRELGFRLQYPSYREGLAAEIEAVLRNSPGYDNVGHG